MPGEALGKHLTPTKNPYAKITCPVGHKRTLKTLKNEFSRLEIALDYNVHVAFFTADSSPTTALTRLVFK